MSKLTIEEFLEEQLSSVTIRDSDTKVLGTDVSIGHLNERQQRLYSLYMEYQGSRRSSTPASIICTQILRLMLEYELVKLAREEYNHSKLVVCEGFIVVLRAPYLFERDLSRPH
jgi:hypothetical protein